MPRKFIPLEYTSDARIGSKPQGDEPRKWPDLDVFGDEYVRSGCNTMTLPHNPGLFIVMPLGLTGEGTVEVRKDLTDMGKLKDPDAHSVPLAEHKLESPVEGRKKP